MNRLPDQTESTTERQPSPLLRSDEHDQATASQDWDDEWLAAPTNRSRLRPALLLMLAGSLCFLGGVTVQQHFGSAPTTARAGLAGLPGGAGGFPGGGQAPGGGALPDFADLGGQTGAGATAGRNAGTDDAGSRDSVVGNVVSVDGDTWTIEDLGGTTHTVVVDDQTTVTRQERMTRDQVHDGDLVAIEGTTDGDQLQAEDVTLR